MRNKKLLFLIQAAMIAALYCVLTAIAAGFNLASGAIQVRFSEALCVLPFFTPAAVPGVIVGCFLSNILTGCALPDIIFGTLATAIGAVLSYLLRKNRILVTIPPVISNMIIIPFVLRFAYGVPDGIPFLALTVGAGEVISCVVFGSILITALMPVRNQVFGDAEQQTA
ncbi:MAG: QueT transporter family protein [Butyrivibrio sp.]|nr:QueT transporter family protein [Butyrivibrio sp.]